MENKKTFMALNFGANYVYHGEAFVADAPYYKPADGDKKAMLQIPVVIGRNPWLLLGEDVVNQEAGNPSVNEQRPFVRLNLFGSMASVGGPAVANSRARMAPMVRLLSWLWIISTSWATRTMRPGFRLRASSMPTTSMLAVMVRSMLKSVPA